MSLIFGLVLFAALVKAQQNPHGETLAFDCVDCHTTEGWTFSASTTKFNHDSTNFKLEGQHRFATCKSCHTTLVFSEAKTNCMDCHTDMHNNTLGLDCARCHDSKSWIVDNITEIHQQSGFPLLGAHNAVDCSSCHTSASQLEFQPLGVECIDCHRQDFNTTTNLSHQNLDFSSSCTDCHTTDPGWKPARFDAHDNLYFPIYSGAHRGEWDNCIDCHTQPETYTVFSCTTCHEHNQSSTDREHDEVSGYSYSSAAC